MIGNAGDRIYMLGVDVDQIFPTLEACPLHEAPPDSRVSRCAWWACEFPERPGNVGVRWDMRCRPCAIHAYATLKNDPSLRDELAPPHLARLVRKVMYALDELHHLPLELPF